jgi:hypothetical protein
MPVITIYRGAFTAGEEIAKGVAQALGYRCVSREVLIEASRNCGISEAKLNEILEKDPHWWERWLQNMRPYRIALQAAMCEWHKEVTSFTTDTSAMSFCLGSAMY